MTAQSPPTIVLITADQLHTDALSCYGGEAVDTPNIDCLAGRGIRFDNAYTVSPWCLPARCSLLTGMFPHNSGAYTNYAGWEGRLDPDIPNLYSELHRQDYTIAHIGKCHYTDVNVLKRDSDDSLSVDDFREYYHQLGIDYLSLQDGKVGGVWYPDDYGQDLEEAGYVEAYRDALYNEGNRKVFTFPGPERLHPDSWVGGRATEYLTDCDEEPLFAWISFSGPHFPCDPPAEYLDRVDDDIAASWTAQEDTFDDDGKIHYKSYHGHDDVGRIDANGVIGACKDLADEYWTKFRKHYYANVAQIDEYVGRILDAIDDRYGGDALVVFMADHGEMLGKHRLFGKHNCAYEDVWNVPLIVDQPGQADGQVSDAQVLTVDATATCLDRAGCETNRVDGRDLITQASTGGREYVFSEGGGFAAVSDGSKKYIRVDQAGQKYTELYDLQSDPHEFDNVVADPAYARDRFELQQALFDLLADDFLTFYQRPSGM